MYLYFSGTLNFETGILSRAFTVKVVYSVLVATVVEVFNVSFCKRDLIKRIERGSMPACKVLPYVPKAEKRHLFF